MDSDLNLKPRRTLVLGDQHGGLRAVEQVLQRCKFNPEEDKLINLGDVVDGWSESAELVEYFIALKEKCIHEPIFLMGNHDEWCRNWLVFNQMPDVWTRQGGDATLMSYQDAGFSTDKRHADFFNKLRLYHVDDQNRAFVHAGYTSHKGLGHEPNMADYYWDRELWNKALFGRDYPLLTILKPHKEIYIGHTTTLSWQKDVPMNACNVWNMDTGAGYGGKLSIMDIDTKEYWQSDLLKTLYPNERGR